jgi:hypothetical protein
VIVAAVGLDVDFELHTGPATSTWKEIDPMAVSTMERYDQSEGRVAKAIERQTSRLPSDTFLWAATGAIGASVTLQMMGKQHASLFVGQWAPTLLILGLYNKLVKQLGSDRTENAV